MRNLSLRLRNLQITLFSITHMLPRYHTPQSLRSANISPFLHRYSHHRPTLLFLILSSLHTYTRHVRPNGEDLSSSFIQLLFCALATWLNTCSLASLGDEATLSCAAYIIYRKTSAREGFDDVAWEHRVNEYV